MMIRHERSALSPVGVHPDRVLRPDRRDQPLQILRPGVAAAVDEVRLEAGAAGPGAQALAALPVAAPERPDEDDAFGPDAVKELGHAVAPADAHEKATRLGDELLGRDPPPGAHLASEVHEPGFLETLDLVMGELDAHALPTHLRDVGRERRELQEHVGLIGVDDQLTTGPPRRPEAAHETVEVLARGGDRQELLRVIAVSYTHL